tara:strand:- start:186 stop:788 length:603 start_codon:yes stop_codon:yes gene_type:complete
MARTTFSGPVASDNGFIGGTVTSPITVTTAQNINSSFGSTSATTGDTRLSYNKLTFTSTGSGETIRAFSVVTGTNAATAGTINGAHISLEVDGAAATISGAANAIRATLGGSDATPGGTLAVIQLDTNYSVNATLPATASFIRVTDSGANTGEIPLFINIDTAPAATIAPTATSVTTVSKAIKVMIGGTVYYVPAYATFS